MELTEGNKKLLEEKNIPLDKKDIKKVNGKKFIKGGRLFMYPPGFNIYRCSRDIKQPIIYTDTYSNIKKKQGLGKPCYKTTKYIDYGEFNTFIDYEQYNILRPQCKADF